MGTLGAAMFTSLAILISLCSGAFADCDLANYDKTSPPALRGGVDNNFAHFEYASDADAQSNQFWIWNYIQNKRTDKGIGANWPKAGIHINVLYPLPPGKAACRWFSVAGYSKDSDAPITYGTTDQQEMASVYAPPVANKTASTSSRISTTFTNEGREPVDLNVDFSTFQSGNGIYYVIVHTPGFVVGIAGLPKLLSQKQIDLLSADAKAQNASVERASYLQYTGEESTNNLKMLFDPEKGPNAKTDFLFFSGASAKIHLETEGGSVQQTAADMVILDAKLRRPVFATSVSLLVPTLK